MSTKIVKKKEIRYKTYNQNITIDLPVLVSDYVKNNALVQIVDKLVEQLSLNRFSVYYSDKGRPAYHPKMMLKVWIYGYCTGVYTSRPLSKQLRENLCFLWLSGGHRPCFKTLCNFRSNRMEGMLDEVFKEVLVYLVMNDYVDLDKLYTDGTKVEANNNKHKIVWRKNIERYKSWVEQRVDKLLEEITALQLAEDLKYGNKDLESEGDIEKIQFELNSESLQNCVNRLNEVSNLEENKEDKSKQKEINRLSKKMSKEVKKLSKYEKQEALLGGRNSYSKTDIDATGLRMKDDLLRPGYNVEHTVSEQYITNVTIHQTASDSVTLIEHLEKQKKRVEGIVEENWQPSLGADAGYGSEENYEYLEEQGITPFVKYPSWYADQSGKTAKKVYHKNNWTYDEAMDTFTCPNNKKLSFREEREKITANGFKQLLRIYECESCKECPFFKECRGEKADLQSNRKIQINRNLERHKRKVKKLLETPEGLESRKQRGYQVETPFANIKYNMGYRRFILRGLEKVYIESLLLAIAHNIRKIYCEETGCWKEYYAQRAAKKVA